MAERDTGLFLDGRGVAVSSGGVPMVRVLGYLPFLLALLLLCGPTVADEDEIRERRRKIEVKFAASYMKIAKEAKRNRGLDLCERAFARVETLDPGNDDAIEFEPTVKGKPSKPQRRKLGKLEKQFGDLRLKEAKQRLDLALWLDGEVLIEESIAEAREALTLAPGPISFNEEGVLSTPKLGRLPCSLSISVLDEHEVVAGDLVPVDQIPEALPWSKGWTLKTKHFLIKTNVSGRLCRTVGRALEAAREIYAEETGFKVKRRISVYILRTRKAYEDYWVKLGKDKPHPGNVGRCYQDHCAIDGTRPTREVVSTAIHEVAHGYFNLGHRSVTGEDGVNMPPWFAEGLATYCAGYGKDSLSFDSGVVLPRVGRDGPLKRFQTLTRLGQARSLEDFMHHEKGDSLFYYQACAFYWFFKETEDQNLKTLYHRAVKEMVDAALDGDERTAGGTAIFRRVMGGDLSELEEEFFAWVRGLTFQAPED